jgi:hypothetical protein
VRNTIIQTKFEECTNIKNEDIMKYTEIIVPFISQFSGGNYYGLNLAEILSNKLSNEKRKHLEKE